MASQRPPAWFRLSSMRAAAPPPAPAPVRPTAPIRPPAPAPAIVRPSIPFRPPPPPTPAQEPPPPPPPAASLPPSPPKSPVAAPRSPVPPSPPKSPVAAPRSPVPPPPPKSPVAAPRSPVPPPPPPRSPLVTPAPQLSPQRATVVAPKSPTPPPRTPPPSSPVTKSTLTTSTNFQQPSPSLSLSPQRKMQSPSKPASPAQKPSATPEVSPKTVKPWENSPAQSPPMMKPLSNPPSPLSLPPPQIKTLEREREREPRIEQKNVLVQESIDKPMKTQNPPHNKGKREVAAAKAKKESDSEESGMRIITIAGENRGAVMEISSARNKNQQLLGNPHILKKNVAAEEEQSKNKDKNDKTTTMQTQPITTYLNSNVQGINNSIVFNSKCNHNDPGIHLSMVTKPSKD